MNYSYVSIVIPKAAWSNLEEIQKFSEMLKQASPLQEIILTVPFGYTFSKNTTQELQVPTSVVYTRREANQDQTILAGLSRAVGDYVVLWSESITKLDEETLDDVLSKNKSGQEVVRITQRHLRLDRWLLKFSNLFRKDHSLINYSLSYSFSRHALNSLMTEMHYENNLNVAILSMPLNVFDVEKMFNPKTNNNLKFRYKLEVVSRATKIGETLPIILAFISGFLALSVAVYAVLIYLLVGRAPEGWTTLMVAIGLGQTSVLAVLALVWTKINKIEMGLKRSTDVTSNVEVWGSSF